MTTLPPLRVGNPKAIERKQRDQRVITHGREPSGDEQRAEFIAVKTRGMRFVVEARTANMRRGGMLNEVFFFGVPVEGRDRA